MLKLPSFRLSPKRLDSVFFPLNLTRAGTGGSSSVGCLGWEWAVLEGLLEWWAVPTLQV